MQALHRKETLFAVAARTATVQKELRPLGARGLLLVIDVDTIAATPSVTPKLVLKDNADAFNIPFWTAAAAITATGQFTYLLYPGASGGNVTEVDGVPIPEEVLLEMTHGDADSITYGVYAHWLP
jgi:hypothetical protein